MGDILAVNQVQTPLRHRSQVQGMCGHDHGGRWDIGHCHPPAAGVVSSAQQTGLAGSDGRVRLTWTVNTSGSYVATGTAGNFPVSGSASVQ